MLNQSHLFSYQFLPYTTYVWMPTAYSSDQAQPRSGPVRWLKWYWYRIGVRISYRSSDPSIFAMTILNSNYLTNLNPVHSEFQFWKIENFQPRRKSAKPGIRICLKNPVAKVKTLVQKLLNGFTLPSLTFCDTHWNVTNNVTKRSRELFCSIFINLMWKLAF